MPVIALLGVPWDGSSSFQRGAAAGPSRIREALWSPSSNSWNERGDDLAAAGILRDAGDLACGASADHMRHVVEQGVRNILSAGDVPLVLGGDHSISYPILRAVGAEERRPVVVHLDAHGDLYDAFEGDRYSHACPFARIMEERLASRLIQVGVRTLTNHQRAQASKFGVETFPPAAWRDAVPVIAALHAPIYVSLDLDVLEPMLAPGIAHPEPGGLTVLDVLEVLNATAGRIVGADVVEYNPDNDVRDLTARVAAKFVKELVGLMRR